MLVMDIIYTIKGIVKQGKRRGKTLGFPTANIDAPNTIDEGVYLSKTEIDGQSFPSLAFVGTAKTFGEDAFQAESFILNFNQEIYGKEISIQLLKKLRDNMTFPSAEKLKEQMEKDRKEAEAFFQDIKNGV